MHSSYSLSKRLALVFFFATQLFLIIHNVSSLNLTNEYLNHKCRADEGIYKLGSKYEENLNILIRDMSKDSFRNGFERTSLGKTPNSVSIIYACRGDSYGSNCRSCFATSVAAFRRRCKRNKGGIIWYDQCILDISNTNNRQMPRDIDYENTFSLHNPKNITGDVKSFNKKTWDFLYKLTIEANREQKDGEEVIHYAAGEKRLGPNKLYAMVQCAKDIILCKDCLEWSIKELSKCCEGKQGGRVLSSTCNLRYELYPFLRT